MTRPLSYFNQSLAERRRREVDRIEDMTAKDSTVSGRQLIQGAGQVTIDVLFPITFAQRPVFHYGWELEENYAPVDQLFPGGDACVVKWTIQGRIEGAFDGFFVGCSIALNVRGDPLQLIWFHWSFRGTGLRNPVHTQELLEDDL